MLVKRTKNILEEDQEHRTSPESEEELASARTCGELAARSRDRTPNLRPRDPSTIFADDTEERGGRKEE